jgi:outer membrane protein
MKGLICFYIRGHRAAPSEARMKKAASASGRRNPRRLIACGVSFLLVFALSGASVAQEKVEPRLSLSLEDAISTAFANNREIQIQEQEIQAARGQILEAKSNFIPKLNMDSAYTHNGAVLEKGGGGGKKDIRIFSGFIDDNKLGLRFNEEIFTGGANISKLAMAKLGLVTQEETLRAKKLDVEFEAKRLFYGLLLAYETERIMKELVDKAEAHYQDVKRKFEQGTSSRFDVLQSKVHVSLSVPELVKASAAADLIKAELKKLLYLKMQDTIGLEGKMDYIPVEIREDEFLKEAYLNMPEMILRSLGIDIRKWAVKAARSSGLPQIAAGGGYDYISNNWGNMLDSRHNDWNIGVTFTMPIFDGFYTKAKVEQAKARYAQANLAKEDLVEQVAVDIRKACLDLVKAQSIIDSQKDNIAEAKEALLISEIGYDNGVGTNLDVLEAQVALSQVEKNLSEGIYDYIMAKASLDRTMGRQYLRGGKR